MKFSNFRVIKSINKNLWDRATLAEVDCTTGFLCWKKTKTVKVLEIDGYWYYADTGKYIEDAQIRMLAYKDQEDKNNTIRKEEAFKLFAEELSKS